MRASERSKNKFKAIKESRWTLRFYEKRIRFYYPLRNQERMLVRLGLKQTIEKFHRALFSLRAMEKQIKMPVKVVVVEAEMYKHRIILGCFMSAIFCINKEYQCPMCGEVVRKELSYCIDKGQKLNYCPHCGQKLWWR